MATTPHPMITDPHLLSLLLWPAPRKKLDSEFSEEENNLRWLILKLKNIHVKDYQQRKEDLFDEYERFRAIGNESIHDYFVRFHKLVNDMKITQLNIPTHQMNTKFVNNLPAYWGKYVTNVKQNMDISTTPYVQIYTHLKAYEPHAKKTLRNRSSLQYCLIHWPKCCSHHISTVLSSPSTPRSSTYCSYHRMTFAGHYDSDCLIT
ncbi:hypothetical protein Tco_0644701 [Tanacetum coccineum]